MKYSLQNQKKAGKNIYHNDDTEVDGSVEGEHDPLENIFNEDSKRKLVDSEKSISLDLNEISPGKQDLSVKKIRQADSGFKEVLSLGKKQIEKMRGLTKVSDEDPSNLKPGKLHK